jgi:hypothetical protein
MAKLRVMRVSFGVPSDRPPSGAGAKANATPIAIRIAPNAPTMSRALIRAKALNVAWNEVTRTTQRLPIPSARHGGSVRHYERVAFEDSERLQEFVDDEDIDGVLSCVTLEQIGQAGCRHTKRALAHRIRGEEYEDGDLVGSRAISHSSMVARRGLRAGRVACPCRRR